MRHPAGMRQVLVAACVACLSACGTGVPATTARPMSQAPATYAGMFGIPGEAMEYKVAFRGVSVASVVVEVGTIAPLAQHAALAADRGQPTYLPPPPPHRTLTVTSRGRTAGLMSLLGDIDWRLETTLDLDAGRGVEGVEESTIVIAGNRDHDKQTRRWYQGAMFDDLHTAAAKLRAWQPLPGQRLQLVVRVDRLYLDTELWRAGREVISAPRPMPAIRYEGTVSGRARFAVWISDDAARVPLRLRAHSKVGEIDVDLAEYDPPPEAPREKP